MEMQGRVPMRRFNFIFSALTILPYFTYNFHLKFNFYLSKDVQRCKKLFAQTKYKEAAKLIAESPQKLPRTPNASRDKDLSVEIVSYGEAFKPYKSHFACELSDEVILYTYVILIIW